MNDLSILDLYRPRRGWFAHDPFGIHGIVHAARVLVWAEHIAQWMKSQGVDVDVEAVRWAAAIHDVGRQDDGRDSGHGERSAKWLARNHHHVPVAIDDSRMKTIQYVCTWHVPRDEFAPKMTSELICLKDADGLDRVRIYDLNPKLLRTDYARSLAADAQRLLDASDRQASHDPWSQVRQAAIELSLWR